MALLRFGRIRRRRAGAGSILVAVGIGGALFAYDRARDSWQESESYSGKIVRIYSEKPFLSGRHSTRRDHYWDVESADGSNHAARIRPESAWRAASEGEWIIKREGELYPERVGGKVSSRRR